MTGMPLFKIGDLESRCVLLGGMGVGITGAPNVSEWINQGGIGFIASVGLGLLHRHSGGYAEGNRLAFREEIKKTKELIGKDNYSRLGVNIMSAISDWEEMVKIAVDEGVGLITNGAWGKHPIKLPDYIQDKNIKTIPITSSARGVELVCKWWYKQFKRFPEAITIEGLKAGGHLGIRNIEEARDNEFVENYLEREVRNAVGYLKENELDIPLIVAGGIFYGSDVKRAIEDWGASAVQIGTRAVPTKECPVHENFKRAYLNAKKEDMKIIQSPVRLPGSVIDGDFFETLPQEVKCRYKCLQTCTPENSEYCIAEALASAYRGDLKNGFVFAGRRAPECTPKLCLDENGEFITIKKLLGQLEKEY